MDHHPRMRRPACDLNTRHGRGDSSRVSPSGYQGHSAWKGIATTEESTASLWASVIRSPSYATTSFDTWLVDALLP